MDHTVEPGAFRKRRKNLMIGYCFGVELFSSIQGMVHVVRSNYGIHHSAMDCIGLSVGFILIGSSKSQVTSGRLESV